MLIIINEKRIRVLLNMLFRYAEKLDIVDKQYSKYLKLVQSGKVHSKKIFTEKEIEVLF